MDAWTNENTRDGKMRSISYFLFVSFSRSPAGGRSPDGPRYPGDWEIKIEPAERKLRKRALVRRRLVVLEILLRRAATSSDAGEIFDLNIRGERDAGRALARSNFSCLEK